MEPTYTDPEGMQILLLACIVGLLFGVVLFNQTRFLWVVFFAVAGAKADQVTDWLDANLWDNLLYTQLLSYEWGPQSVLHGTLQQLQGVNGGVVIQNGNNDPLKVEVVTDHQGDPDTGGAYPAGDLADKKEMLEDVGKLDELKSHVNAKLAELKEKGTAVGDEFKKKWDDVETTQIDSYSLGPVSFFPSQAQEDFRLNWDSGIGISLKQSCRTFFLCLLNISFFFVLVRTVKGGVSA
jgi:hypothetical protein